MNRKFGLLDKDPTTGLYRIVSILILMDRKFGRNARIYDNAKVYGFQSLLSWRCTTR